MRTVCSNCHIPLEPRTKKIRILSSGAIGCDRCYWEEKGKKKGSAGRGRGFKPPTQPHGNIVNI